MEDDYARLIVEFIMQLQREAGIVVVMSPEFKRTR